MILDVSLKKMEFLLVLGMRFLWRIKMALLMQSLRFLTIDLQKWNVLQMNLWILSNMTLRRIDFQEKSSWGTMRSFHTSITGFFLKLGKTLQWKTQKVTLEMMILWTFVNFLKVLTRLEKWEKLKSLEL